MRMEWWRGGNVDRVRGEREGEGMSDGEGRSRRKKVMMADHRRFCSACE